MAEGYSFANLLECLTLEAGNEQEVLDYYRSCLASRIGDYWLDEVGPIMSKGLEEEMDAYMENIFPFNGIVSDQRDGINWYAAPDGDLEWNGGFVRHGYMAYLAERYSRTRDERIAAKIISDMLDYIEKVPPYDPEGKPYLEYKKSTWRPFEAAGRAAENWPVILRRIIDSASMDAESFCRILYSVHQHAVFLFHHHWKTGNHACLETAGLCVISVFFPEFRESEEWIRYSLAFLEKMVDEQFYPDGYTREMSGAYHFVAMRSFFQIYEVLSANGRASLVPPAIMEYLGKSALAEFYQMKPDGSLPVTNDSNLRTNHGKYLKKMRPLLPEGYSDYALSGGKEGRKPARESYMLPDAMLGIMRNGWDRDSVYLDFDMGPW
ncbi:MAG: heparinase II/III family protein, partial [Candidatus Ornithospirochaeta sp.]|nr:heparinase II/III family protein [Candidatus Ornithospirochaeta sp.]